MVQRKAPHRWLGSQAELKTNSRQQDAGRRRGGGGSEDIKKKMKMERSIIAAELDSPQGFKNSSTTKRRPNYMKPTSSSNARTDVSNPTASKGTAAKSSRGVVVVVSRATCSSTLKGSMFPKALDLAPGGTEAEGTSAIRVCPYTYCSLNGHRHEPLPPLRRFVSARRRLLKTQKRVLSSFKAKGLKEEEEEEMEIDTGQEALARCSSADDFFVEIYTTKPQPDADGELGEVDASGEGKAETEKATEVELSECSEKDFGLPQQVMRGAEVDELLLEVQEILVDESAQEDDWAEEVEDASSLSIAQIFDSCDILTELEKSTPCDAEESCAYDGQTEEEHQEKFFNLEESIDETKARMRTTSRKKTSKDPEETKEFNPRGPRFLPAEPDPEAEKVDLRHQTMDERKNSEEWMIDYALRRAVMKLAPAPKKKVAVLVEAFETVAPLPAWGKPRRHSTPGFSHARIVQACS